MSKWAAGLFAGVAVLALAGWTGSRFLSGPGAEAREAAPPVNPGNLETGKPVRRNFKRECPWFGVVEARKQVEIRALAPGRILRVEAEDESRVKKGDLLFTMGGPSAKRRISELEKRIASLEARRRLLEEKADLLEKAFQRRLTSKESLLSARDALAALRLDLENARAERDLQVEYLRLRSPMEGIFTGRSVSPGQDVAAGERLAFLVGVKALRIRASLFPPEGAEILGKRAEIRLPGGGSLPGRVSRVLPARTPLGAARAWIEAPGLEERLKPGESVEGVLLLTVKKGALAVPEDALVRDQEENTFVYVRVKKGFRKRAVKTGLESEGYVEILSGLSGDERVVVRGAYELFYRDFNKIYQAED